MHTNLNKKAKLILNKKFTKRLEYQSRWVINLNVISIIQLIHRAKAKGVLEAESIFFALHRRNRKQINA